MGIEFNSLVIAGFAAIGTFFCGWVSYKLHLQSRTRPQPGPAPVNIRDSVIHLSEGVADQQSTPVVANPQQRPPEVDHFLGRDAILNVLLEEARPGVKVSICGPGGMGKTNLASKIIWELFPDGTCELFPDGIVYYSFYGQPSTDGALEYIARSFGAEPTPSPFEAAFAALTGKQALLYLDGTEAAEDLGRVLEVVGGCCVLITSRSKNDAPDPSHRFDLAPFDTEDSLKLLEELAADQIDNRVAAADVARLVGNLPLAINLIGRYLSKSGYSVTRYLTMLADSPLNAPGLNEKEKRLENVNRLLAGSVKEVSTVARRVLALCGQLSLNPFDEDMVRQVLGLSSTSIMEVMSELIDYGLVVRVDDRVRVHHALIYAYIGQEVSLSASDFYQLVAHFDAHVLEQRELGMIGYQVLNPDRPHLMHVLSTCIENADWESAKRLSWTLEDYLDMQGFMTERMVVSRSGLLCAQQLANRQDEGRWLGILGLAYRHHGQVEKAIRYHERALAIAREIGDRQNEGNQLGNLGNAFGDLGQVEKAIEYFEGALAISREIGDQQHEGGWLGNLGFAHHYLGKADKAIEYIEEGLAINRDVGDGRREGTQLGNLGLAYRDLGQVEKAIECHEAALAISREIGDREGEGIQLGDLGIAYRDLGQVEKARAHLRASLAILEEIKSPRAESIRVSLDQLVPSIS